MGTVVGWGLEDDLRGSPFVELEQMAKRYWMIRLIQWLITVWMTLQMPA